MSMKFWVPLALALSLLVTGCGEEPDAPVNEQDASEQASASPEDEAASPADEEAEGEPASSDSETTTTAAASGGEAAEPSASADESTMTEEELSTLEASQEGGSSGVLDESEALPGEASGDDVDAIIEETERRFQEASQKIDQQFKEAEQQAPEATSSVESDTGADLDEALESSGELPEDPATLDEASSDPEVQAILEETEKRFQEASQKIDQQFEQAEQAVPDEVRESTTTTESGSSATEEGTTP